MKKITTLLLFIFSIVCYGQEEVLLRLKYEAGDEYKVNMIMKQEMGTFMTNNMVFTMSQKITSTTDSIYENIMTIDQIKMDVTQGGGETNSYDSAKEIAEDGSFEAQMHASVGKMIGVEIFSKGNYLGEVFDMKAAKPVPGLENMTDNSGVVYPKEAVKVGSSWKTTKKQNGIDMTFNYKVTEITKSVVKVDVSGSIAGSGEDAISGTLIIDRNTGVPFDSNIVIEIEMQSQKILTALQMSCTKV